ncbi:SMI1/KNR4 family protein [Frankia sp. CNm7]|uniref:SMI1/KNR4 family protein n=1 Tax=Frankia nepalensis TaxID=1836974 RepID=A0A937UNA5_9ACTN|nr:hypothetical protein [Frankia nepalensis]MBL7495834.1 SMI1/KNR4 family protein [Frankia nepalensis]MBL7509910.1 SMI1/KNR4 family protein [Frankia nepalensis]MBL7521082.1 SMI1/KNR4 family protein [Frankia nepalensis]MBL7629669.1 hypothetical protein [Frankia nepalensis]
MTDEDDRSLPAALRAVAQVEFDYADGDGVDFEPYLEFMPAQETTDWFRAWTGNHEVSGERFRPFGQDGTGGLAAFWQARPVTTLVDQPIVFLGSEGETGVVARDLAGFLWLLADGLGPWEAIDPFRRDRPSRPNAELIEIAERFAAGARQTAAAVIEQASREFPDFERTIVALCR